MRSSSLRRSASRSPLQSEHHPVPVNTQVSRNSVGLGKRPRPLWHGLTDSKGCRRRSWKSNKRLIHTTWSLWRKSAAGAEGSRGPSHASAAAARLSVLHPTMSRRTASTMYRETIYHGRYGRAGTSISGCVQNSSASRKLIHPPRMPRSALVATTLNTHGRCKRNPQRGEPNVGLTSCGYRARSRRAKSPRPQPAARAVAPLMTVLAQDRTTTTLASGAASPSCRRARDRRHFSRRAGPLETGVRAG